MKAIVCPAYGSPDVLLARDLPAPLPADDEIVVDVSACSVNSADVHLMRGDSLPLRLVFGLSRPRFSVLGADVAGTVRAKGAAVTHLSVGDAVVGDLSSHRMGGFAEQVAAPAKFFVRKPDALSFVDAAAVPMAGVTAQRAVRDVARVTPGQRVLVVGAAGGVGSFAIQLARAIGAEVSAMCHESKHAVPRALGVIDVWSGDALDEGALDGRFDVVIDAAAYRWPFAWRRALAKGGTYVLVGGAFPALVACGLLGPLVGPLIGKRFVGMVALASAEDLESVLALIGEGRVRPLVDRTFSLDETSEAVRHVEDRKARGKVVVTVA